MSLLVLGGNSYIAQKVAAKFAEAGHAIYLLGRREPELNKVAQDLAIKYGVKTAISVFDATDYQSHEALIKEAFKQMPDLEYVLLAFGYLGQQEEAVKKWAETEKILTINFLGAASVLTHIANHFEQQGKGTIMVISSVAGDRGRQSNYVYGAAKGGLSVFCQGLRNRLAKKGVKVITIKPGFVDTPMTYGLDLPKPLVASPDKVANDIFQAALKGKDILYTPGYWRWIMRVVKAVPERTFKKLNL